MKQVVFITGASKGIGKALAKTYFKNGFKVFSFARTKSDLPKEIIQIKTDLTNEEELKQAINKAFAEVNATALKRFTLINNAGRLGKIAFTENLPLADIAASIQLNVTATIQISSLVIAKLKEINAIKTIVNISSGAAENPYTGWSVYCASKAAVDMFTKTVALEQQEVKYPFKVFAIRPGVVATAMQEQIRKTQKEDFKMVDKFIELYQKNKLSPPLEVAQKMYLLDTSNQIKNGSIIDLRNIVL